MIAKQAFRVPLGKLSLDQAPSLEMIDRDDGARIMRFELGVIFPIREQVRSDAKLVSLFLAARFLAFSPGGHAGLRPGGDYGGWPLHEVRRQAGRCLRPGRRALLRSDRRVFLGEGHDRQASRRSAAYGGEDRAILWIRLRSCGETRGVRWVFESGYRPAGPSMAFSFPCIAGGSSLLSAREILEY